VLRLHASLDARREPAFASLLRELEGVRRVVRHPDESCEAGQTVFVADVEPSGADALITAIEEMGTSVDDYVLPASGWRSAAVGSTKLSARWRCWPSTSPC
jgi:hypothetical protein